MALNEIDGDLNVRGRVSAHSMTLPLGTVVDGSVASAGNLAASKLEHRHALSYAQVPGTAVLAETRDLHIVRGVTDAFDSFEAAVTGAIATGGDRTVTVDLHKGNAGAAFATVLAAALSFSSADALRTPKTASITGTVADGDILRVVVAVAGAAGAQAQGLVVTVNVRESGT